MQAARIAELLQPFVHGPDDRRLTSNHLDNISTYIDILLRWNARVNLTAIRDPEQIVTRHFGESLFAARHLFPGESREGRAVSRTTGSPDPSAASALEGPTVADVGSGAGFPGIPLKLWAPEISLTLIESNHKKVAFLREIARSLTLTGINILSARAENLGQAFDIVTLRAVERFDRILPIATRLVAPAGRLALLIGRSQLEKTSPISAFTWQAPVSIPASASRVLLIGKRNQRCDEPFQ